MYHNDLKDCIISNTVPVVACLHMNDGSQWLETLYHWHHCLNDHGCTFMMHHNHLKDCISNNVSMVAKVAHLSYIAIVGKLVSSTAFSQWLLWLHIHGVSLWLETLYHWHHCLKKITVLTLLVLRPTYSS